MTRSTFASLKGRAYAVAQGTICVPSRLPQSRLRRAGSLKEGAKRHDTKKQEQSTTVPVSFCFEIN
ncbi:MAG: hypothetical protein II875_14980, partial [Clostridia bacterium]|nr:hypothetical protein [Clostridia bacterium]